MSFILDALKKLEQKRQQDNIPNIATVHTPDLKTPAKRPVWPYLLVAALLLNAGILSGWIITRNSETPDTAPAIAEATSEKASPADPSPIEKEANLSEPLPSAPVTVSNTVAVKAEQEMPLRTVTDPEPSVKPEEKSVDTLQPVTLHEEARPAPSPDDYSTASLQLSPSADELESLKSIIRDEQEHSGKEDSRTVSEQDVNEAHPGQEIPELSELPSDVRKEIPDISIFGHIYSGSPSSRLVNINGSLVREGDTVTGKLKVTEITLSGVVFDYKGLRFRVRAF